MRLFGFEISRIETIDARIDERAANVLDRYAHNTEALRAAVAGNLGLTDPKYVREDSFLLPPMTRAIKAFAASVVKERGPIKRSRTIKSEDWPAGKTSVLRFFPRAAA